MRLHAEGFIPHHANHKWEEGGSSACYEGWIMLWKQKQIAMADTTDEYVLMFATSLMCESAKNKKNLSSKQSQKKPLISMCDVWQIWTFFKVKYFAIGIRGAEMTFYQTTSVIYRFEMSSFICKTKHSSQSKAKPEAQWLAQIMENTFEIITTVCVCVLLLIYTTAICQRLKFVFIKKWHVIIFFIYSPLSVSWISCHLHYSSYK